jgi:hypothetical protein
MPDNTILASRIVADCTLDDVVIGVTCQEAFLPGDTEPLDITSEIPKDPQPIRQKISFFWVSG